MLTSLFLERGVSFFASGWTQFALAFGLAFLIVLLFGRPFINAMHRIQKRGQPISENVPQSHRAKAGTPTMGGLLVNVAIIIPSILFMPILNPTGWIALLALVMFGAIGFFDDYKKVVSQSKKASNGLSPMLRLGLEAICVIILAYLINQTIPLYIPELSLALPFGIILPLGIFYYVFAYFVIAGSANATNITDGLDGMLAKIYMPVLVVWSTTVGLMPI